MNSSIKKIKRRYCSRRLLLLIVLILLPGVRPTFAADEVYIALQDKIYDSGTRVMNVAAQPLGFFEKTILTVDYPPIDDLAANPLSSVGTLNALGTIGGKRVFTADYPSGLIAVIAEQQQDLFLPVLYVHRRVNTELLKIINVEGREFLAYVGDSPGTGNFKDEYYFAVVEGKLRRIEYEEQLQAELDRVLPEKYGVWKGGGFDISTLTFRNSVWKEGDSNAEPSGGEITVNFRFDNNVFVVQSSDWRQTGTP